MKFWLHNDPEQDEEIHWCWINNDSTPDYGEEEYEDEENDDADC